MGPSNRIEYRLRGRVSRLRAFFVWSPQAGVPARTLQKAGAPPIVPRSGWNADEKIRRADPSYASAVRLALVHHTAGKNGYSAAEAPAIVRAIELYHVKGNGWNDIGYNFLVDRFGQVYEGRYGGTDRSVVGAHAEGFNTGSVGVAVLGEYSSLAIAAKARDSLARLLAWRLDIAHVDPASTLSFISGGNARFPAGLPVFLRAVSGHRDAGFTDCPGAALYKLLSSIGGDVAKLGLPKLYAPTMTGTVPGKVRFRARLSAPLAWTVEVYDANGSTLASSDGFGGEVDWTWDAALLPPGSYSYAIRSEENVTPAVGSIGGGALALAVTGLAGDPETVSPNDDGVADQSTITYSLTSPANVTVKVRNDQGLELVTLSKGLAPRRRARGHVRRCRAAGRDLPRRGRGGRHGWPPGRHLDADRGHAHARRRAGRANRVLAEPGRARRPDRLQVRADRAGRGAPANPEERQVGCDSVQGPAREGCPHVRMGRDEAARTAPGR